MSWLTAGLSAVAGILGAGGQAATNRANRDMARERMSFEDKQAERQMGFQERMSSTAAQRSVEDFRKAGLNPALAYGTTASTPSGASGSGAQSVSENVAESGMSSARAAASLKQQMDIARAQNVADLRLKEANTVKAQTEAATSVEYGSLMKQQMAQVAQQTLFASQAQPGVLRKLFSEAVLSELSQASARNESALSTRLGEWRPAMGMIGSSARSVLDFSRLIPRVR